MKKILFLSYCLPPYLYPQSIQVGRFLEALKGFYDVYIVTAEEKSFPDPDFYPNIFEGISPEKVLRVRNDDSIRLNALKNAFFPILSKLPDLYRAWGNKAYKQVLDSYGDVNFDAIITFSYPLSANIIGQKLKDRYGCVWIAHQSDPWADNPFMGLGPITKAINNNLERRAFSCADYLIFTCEEAQDFYREKYTKLSDKISFIDHSYDPSLFISAPTKKNEKIIVRYIGGFYGRRTVKPLLDILNKISDRAKANIQFEIVGGGRKSKLMVAASGIPDGLAIVRDKVSYKESLRLMQDSDLLLLIDAPLKKNIFFPSKLVDYIGARRPILGISSPGPASRILSLFGYPCFTHGQIENAVNVIENLVAGEGFSVPDNPSLYAAFEMAENGSKLRKILESIGI